MRTSISIAAITAAIAVGSWPGLNAQGPSAPSGMLLVELGIHVEPVGLANGRISTGMNSYANERLFDRDADYLRELAAAVESHGGYATVQVQSPFIDYAAVYGNVVGELAGRGHEIALHFHEDAHLGRNADTLPVARWTEVVNGQIAKIQALGIDRVRMWSGGNLYPHMLEVAAATGIDVKADWKNPKTQTAPDDFKKTTPWRPAGSPSETDLTAFLQHNPSGTMVFLPPGVIDPQGMHEDEFYASSDPPAALQAYWTEGLSASLASVALNPRATHVFHITLHPGELQRNNLGGITTLTDWLTEEIDPLLAAGKVQWATYSQTADLYAAAAPAMSGLRASARVFPGRATARR